MKLLITIFFVLSVLRGNSQLLENMIHEGNTAYKAGDFKSAAALFQQVLQKDGNNEIAKFNLGNTLVKEKELTSAIKHYEEVASSAKNADLQAKAFYNKGVVNARQQQLLEAIDAFKNALLLNPDDEETKENLQKAMNDLKKKQQQSTPQDKNKPKPKDNKNNNSANQIMEQKFNELRDKEKQLQKMLQQKPTVEQPAKDW